MARSLVREGLFAIFGTVIAATAAAAAEEDCGSHLVAPGETLVSIAQRVDDRIGAEGLVAANRARIGTEAGELKPGTVLAIPCIDKEILGIRVSAARPAAPAAEAAEEAAAARRIRLAQGEVGFPFADPGLTGGGLAPRLAMAALAAAAPGRAVRLDWAGTDAGAALAGLDRGAAALRLGWRAAGCAAAGGGLCGTESVSDSFYDVAYGYFVRDDNPYRNAISVSDFVGARICRSAGNSLSDLAAIGLVAPLVEVTTAPGAAACLEGLAEGRFDIAGIETRLGPAAEAMAEAAETEGARIGPLAGLTHVQSLVAVADAADPAGVEAVRLVSEGLRRLRANGGWFAIVTESLAEIDGPHS